MCALPISAEIPLRGFHNVANVTAAAAIAAACDIGPEAVAAAVRAFQPPAHRLELVGRAGGVDYYNDSIATAPERTLAALRAFEEPVVLLLGGREKKLPLEEMLEVAARRCRAILCFGEAGPVPARAGEGPDLAVACPPTRASTPTITSSSAASSSGASSRCSRKRP